jgi:hypothetical protein
MSEETAKAPRKWREYLPLSEAPTPLVEGVATSEEVRLHRASNPMTPEELELFNRIACTGKYYEEKDNE